MKNLVKFTCLILLVTNITACSSYFYLPTKHNIMPFYEKDDVMLAVSAGINDNFIVEGGYAITDNIGITTSLNTLDISAYRNSKYINNDYIWDNELVFYKNWNENLFSGINTGVGWGKFNAQHPYYNYDFNRQYVLPWFVYEMSKKSVADFSIFWGLSMKFSRVDYGLNTKLDISSEYDNQMFYNYYKLQDMNRDRFIYEAGFTSGLSTDKVKFQFQYQTVVFPTKRTYIIPSNVSVSMYFYINQFFPKKTENK